jgi:hypothetical protein
MIALVQKARGSHPARSDLIEEFVVLTFFVMTKLVPIAMVDTMAKISPTYLRRWRATLESTDSARESIWRDEVALLVWKHLDVISDLGAECSYCRKTSSAGNGSGNERETRVSERRAG